YADDRVWLSIEHDRRPDNAGIGSESTVPETGAEDAHARTPHAIVRGFEEPSTKRRDSENREEVAGGVQTRNVEGRTAVCGSEAEAVVVDGSHLLEGATLLLPVEKVR